MEESRASTGRRIDLPPAFIDARGAILNLLLEQCGGVSIIWSKAGSERSNHHHKTDSHYLYVLSGEMLYQERALDEPHYPPPGVFSAGSMVFTPAQRWHRTTFPVDTVLVSMSKLPRDTATHEADLVRE